MAIHGPAYQLAGDCLAIPTRICMPFKEFCIHTTTYSPAVGQPTNPVAGTFGCMQNAPYTTNYGTQFLPEPKIPSNINRPKLYGIETGSVTLPNLFVSSELAPWRSRKIFGPSDPYGKMTSGPAVQQGHMVTEVRRRLRDVNPKNANFQGRYSFYFTDSTYSINGEDDWLRFLHPAGFFWTNKGLVEPFLAVDYYEDSGQNPITSDIYNQNIIPFCSPMNVWNEFGNIIGQYIGYTFIFNFAPAYVRLPTKKNSPDDYYIDPPTVPATKVDPTNQFFSLDCHLFLVASPAYAGALKSPKLNSIRYWFYNKPTSTYDICSQYMYAVFGQFESEWKFDVTFNKTDGTSEVIKFGISNTQIYVTP